MSAMHRMLGPLQRKVALMVGRAIVRTVTDTTLMQALQLEVLEGEVRGDVERVQNYGFTSVPLAGAEAVAVAVAGSRDHLLVVAVDDRRYRMRSLANGEVAIYTDEGDHVHLKRGGVIEVVAATKVRMVAPLVEVVGDMTVSGSVVAAGEVTGLGTHLHTHIHSDVTAGADVTGAPV